MTMFERGATLMCIPYANLPLPGSQQRVCTKCSGKIWVSAPMVSKVDSREVEPVCIPCGEPLMRSGQSLCAIHPDQYGELAQYGILDFAHRLVTHVNDHFYTGDDTHHGGLHR